MTTPVSPVPAVLLVEDDQLVGSVLSPALCAHVYDEQIRHGLPAGVGLVLLLLVLGGAVIALVRSEAASAAQQVPGRP